MVFFTSRRHVVLQSVRAYILNRLHMSHTGVDACQRRARETVYWPGVTTQVKQLVEGCAVFSSHQQVQQKEPLLSFPPPARP